MDLRALCEGSYEDALSFIEKRAEAARTEPVKAANWFKDVGNDVSNWAGRQVAQGTRDQISSSVGNWWRDTAADPKKLGLLGLGAGAGVGALGSLAGPKGRRRPLSGALLGGLMGGAALGGYGLLRHNQLQNKIPQEQANVEHAKVEAAKGTDRDAQLAADPTTVPEAVANRVRAGDITGAANAADVLGLQEFADESGKNHDLSVSPLINKGTSNATQLFEDVGVLKPGEGESLGNNLQIRTRNPAIEGTATLAAADLAMSRRAGSAYNPTNLRHGLGLKDLSALGNTVPGADPKDVAAQINNSGGLRKAMGGGLAAKVTRPLGLGEVGAGFNYKPPATVPTPAPPGGMTAWPTQPAPVHVRSETLRSIADAGRADRIAKAGDPKSFLRSGFGSAAGGRLGGIGISRGLVYPAVPAGINWTRTRVNDANAAKANLGAAEQAANQAQSYANVMSPAGRQVMKPAPDFAKKLLGMK